MKKIGAMNFGWIVILLGIGMILAGMKMTSVEKTKSTLLFIDPGCVTMQGLTSLVLGTLLIVFGIYVRIIKNK